MLEAICFNGLLGDVASQPSLIYPSLGLIERPTVRVKGSARSNRNLNIT
jgi:hypothetical protein